MFTASRFRMSLATTLLCGVMLSACGRSGDQAAAPKGQVVARVGNEVITAQELENELRIANISPDKQKEPETFKRIMGEIVARKYLVRQAMEAKLDREPSVLLDILRSRDVVLANATLSRSVAAKVSALSNTDVERYIANNPLKFAKRQLMTVEQLSFPIGSNSQTIVDATRGLRSLDEIDQKLTAMNVPHSRSMGAFSSADIPESLAGQLETRKPDEVLFMRVGPNGVFMLVKSEEARPLTGEAAVNFARQSLRADLLKSEAGTASVGANLEAKYEGDYASLMTQ